MFLAQLLSQNQEQTLTAARAFLSRLGPLEHTFECSFEATEDFGGKQAAFLDLYPVASDLAKDHKKFGGIFVRLWVFGAPTTVTSGLFLGAERAEQSEPRRGVTYTRKKLGQALSDFEIAHGFSYHTWSSGNFPWTTKSSRAVARQLEQFVSFRQDPASADQKAIEDKVREAVRFIDHNLTRLKPIREFGQAIIREYYSENLPDVPTSTGLVSGEAGLSSLIPALETGFNQEEVGLKSTHDTLHRFVACLLAKRFLISAGLSGAGKTKLGQAFARWLTPNSLAADPFVPGARFASDRVVYVVKKVDSVSIEFWNEESEGGPIKNMVPREVIAEWADYIERNRITEDVSAQAISEAVEPNSSFTAYLHRFRPFLKLASFALVKARSARVPTKCYELVPVGADWTGNENIIGYPDGLTAENYVRKPALDLIRHALDFADVPHFLILDEMNLSHVERYFADLLSAIESSEEIPLYDGAERKSDGKIVPRRLRLPENLFIIGTVNVDETTYMFSPKVLDRANVIEFRMEPGELAAFLASPKAPRLEELDGKGATFGKNFVEAAADKAREVPESVKTRYEKEMMLFFNLLQKHNAEFGYRTGYEAARFVHFYHLLGGYPGDDNEWFNGAMDAVIVQKFLPKLHGSRSKLEGLLWALTWACGAERKAVPDGLPIEEVPKKENEIYEEFLKECLAAGDAKNETKYAPETLEKSLADKRLVARYPLSFDKLMRMWRKLERDQFVSFAEA